jgi:tetratricopeptide (TPR) repeat protein
MFALYYPKRHKEKIRTSNVDILYLLLFICAGLIFAFPYSAKAQNEESNDLFDILPINDPNIHVFSAVSKAIYWEKMAEIARSIGDKSAENSSYDMASVFYNEAIGFDARSAFLYTKIAEISLNTGDYRKAKSNVETALEFDPNNADAHFLYGSIKYKIEQDKAGALEEFRKSAEANPEHLRAQIYLASLAYDAEEYHLAATAYSSLIKIRPYDAELRYRLGISYSKSGEINKAIEEMKAATMIDENHLDAHFQLALMYANLNRNREAIEECIIVIKRVPQYPDVLLLLAQLYTANEEYDKAISIANDLISKKNSLKEHILAEAYYKMGMAYKEKGDIKTANRNFDYSIELYNSAMQKDQKNINLNFDIAIVYDAKGNIEMAKKHLGKLIWLKPNDAEAYNYLGYLLVENNEELELAIGYIQKALAIDPNNGAYRDSLGWAYLKAGKLDEAISELERAAELSPYDHEIYEHLGEAYLTKGGEYTQRAIQEWEKALELKPNKARLRQKLNDLYAQIDSGNKVEK